jgi:hypothetical protein
MAEAGHEVEYRAKIDGLSNCEKSKLVHLSSLKKSPRGTSLSSLSL